MSALNIKLKSIQFNHKSNSAEGGIHICQKYDKAILPPEWKEAPAQPLPFAVAADKLVNLKIVAGLEYKLDNVVSGKSVKAQVTVKLTNPVTGGNCEASKEITVTQTAGGTSPGNGILEFSVPFDLRGMPGFLKKYDLSLTWNGTSQDVDQVQIDNTTTHTMYVLKKLPCLWRVEEGAAYNASNKDYPSTLVMDYFIALTDYETPKYPSYDNDAVARVTCAVNASTELSNTKTLLRYQYHIGLGSSHYTLWNSTNNTHWFQLKKWQDEILAESKTGKTQTINCIDCAFIVQRLSSLVGEEVSVGILDGNTKGFYYNPIKPIGHNSTSSGKFAFHAVAVRGATVDHTSRIYDACLRLDPSVNIQAADQLPVDMQYAADSGCLSVPTSANHYLNRLVGAQQTSSINVNGGGTICNMAFHAKNAASHADAMKARVQPLVDNVYDGDTQGSACVSSNSFNIFDLNGIQIEVSPGLGRERCEERIISVLMETTMPYTLLIMERSDQYAYSALQFDDWMLLYFDQDVLLRLTSKERDPDLLDIAKGIIGDGLWRTI